MSFRLSHSRNAFIAPPAPPFFQTGGLPVPLTPMDGSSTASNSTVLGNGDEDASCSGFESNEDQVYSSPAVMMLRSASEEALPVSDDRQHRQHDPHLVQWLWAQQVAARPVKPARKPPPPLPAVPPPPFPSDTDTDSMSPRTLTAATSAAATATTTTLFINEKRVFSVSPVNAAAEGHVSAHVPPVSTAAAAAAATATTPAPTTTAATNATVGSAASSLAHKYDQLDYDRHGAAAGRQQLLHSASATPTTSAGKTTQPPRIILL